ncbi:hypothetical protein C9940_00645 [Pseudidiomarina aestuarii]|uniref:Integrase n=1 Tax=Pseudidiomarina aestuarii TaxID=624146 RepID=A0A2T4CZ78_9GAMM|nr:hypothetical protein C9940_00645 [Pseudidiomarina aestuarii]
MAKTSLAFTEARIKSIQPPESGRVEIYDTEVPKLCCRITAPGHKSYVVVGWDNQRQRGIRITLGNVSDLTMKSARELAIKTLSDLKSGIDVMARRQRDKTAQMSLEILLSEYLASRNLRQRTQAEYSVVLERHFADWKPLPLNKITEKMILDRHKILTGIGTATANSAMRVLRLLLRYAHAISIIESIPIDVLSRARLWHKPKRKDRIIPSDRLSDWLEAVEALENIRARVFLLTLLYMGYRTTELRQTRWADVDLRANTIILHDTKNGETHSLPMPTVLHEHFKDLKRQTGRSTWVFASEILPNQPMDSPKRSIKSICATTGIEFSPHDCRRTFATIAESVGVPLTIIKRLLNHSLDRDVTAGYIRTEINTVRDAIERVAQAIDNFR